MLVAVPMKSSHSIYHDNPSTAPQFALFVVEGNRAELRITYKETRQNPWLDNDTCHITDTEVRHCSCDRERSTDIHHIADHYILLEAIKGCDYLLADQFCRNTVRALKTGGIRVYKLPPFIHTTQKAITHFLIGENYADTVQHIHYAS